MGAGVKHGLSARSFGNIPVNIFPVYVEYAFATNTENFWRRRPVTSAQSSLGRASERDFRCHATGLQAAHDFPAKTFQTHV